MSKKFKLLKEQIEDIINDSAIAASRGGLEICGLLIDNGYFTELVKVNNKIKRGGSFAFYVNEIRLMQKAVRLMGHEIIGTFHSHPLYIDEPSDSDIQNALDDSFMLIIDVTERKIGFWYIKDGNKRRVEFEMIGFVSPRRAE
jgi:proteasome lid subunit RPN8/RPN11